MISHANMLKKMAKMEMRIQHLEQQVKILQTPEHPENITKEDMIMARAWNWRFIHRDIHHRYEPIITEYFMV